LPLIALVEIFVVGSIKLLFLQEWRFGRSRSSSHWTDNLLWHNFTLR